MMSENQMQEQEQNGRWEIIAFEIDVEKFNDRPSDPDEQLYPISIQENVICEIGRNKNFITKLVTSSNGSYIITEEFFSHRKLIKMKLNNTEVISKFMGISVNKSFAKMITLVDYKENKSKFIKVYVKILENENKGYVVLKGSGELLDNYITRLRIEDWVMPYQIDFYQEDI